MVAATYYERALAGGLEPETLHKCYLQYGSTLRNLGRIDESIKIFGIAHVAFPNCVSLKIFEILTLHAQGKHNTAVANALNLLADNIQTNEVKRYETAIHANAKHLLNTEQ